MIWFICAVFTVLMYVLCVRSFFDKKQGSLRMVSALLFLFIATFVVYIPAYIESYGFLTGVVGNLVNALQVMTTDADFLRFYNVIVDSISIGLLAKLYVVLVGVAHVALPAVSAFTAVTVLFRCFFSIQLFFSNSGKKPMFVFSQYNERSLHLAKSLQNTKCTIVFAGSDSELSVNENENSSGYIFLDDSISELRIKGKKKNIYFFCLSGNEDESLTNTLQLIEKYSALSEAEQEYIHIYQFSKYKDYSVYIDSADKGSLDVQCINEYEMLVYKLLDKYPLLKYANPNLHVLLHGFSPINVVALKTIAWMGQISGFSMKVSVAGINIGTQIEDIKLNLPGLFTSRYDFNFYDCNTEKEIVDIIREKCADANYIIVSEDTDNDTMNRGLILRRLFYKMDREYKNCPPIFCYIKEPVKFNIVRNLSTAESNPKRKVNYDLIPFGSFEEVYSYKNLVDSDLEKLAKNVHLAYEEIFSNVDINIKAALAAYNVFEVNKRSNRANALHIRYKLNQLGLDYTDEDVAECVQMQDYYSAQVLEQLAISEHDRWMAFLESEGWTSSSKEDVIAYRESGISRGRHNCPALKMHPYICEYDKLRALSIDIEGKDTTVYDKELIVRIPDILGDKWNVAGKKYKIIRLR